MTQHTALGFLGQHSNRDAAVLRGARFLGQQGVAAGHAHHARQLVHRHAGGHQLAARRIGPVGGQLPVAIAPIGIAIGRCIGVARETDAVLRTAHGCANFPKNVAHIWFDQGAAAVEHGAVLLVDDLDHQPVLGDLGANLRAVFVELGVAGDHRFYLGLERMQALSVSLGLISASHGLAGATVGVVIRLGSAHLAVNLG